MAGTDWKSRLILQASIVLMFGTLSMTQPSSDPNSIFSCMFSFGLCNMQQESNDNFDWTFTPGGPTPSGLAHSQPVRDVKMTGPDNGQGASVYRGYVFTEASAPRSDYENARLSTPALNYTNDACLVFYFHMRGSNVGRLQVHYRPERGQRNERQLFDISGSRGDDWQMGEIDVPLRSFGDKVEFSATLSAGEDIWSGDIAIDSIVLTRGRCGGTPPSPAPPTRAPPLVDQALPLLCDFETSLCGLVQERNDHFDWTRLRDSTPTIGTGPTRAYSGFWYIYIETSDPRRSGEVAKLKTLPLLHQGPACLTFAYHLNGPDIGTLSVRTKDGGRNNPWFTKGGDQGGNWRQASVDINLQYTDVVTIEGQRGGDIRGDIAIDDFRLLPDYCRAVAVPSTVQPTAFPPGGPPVTPRPSPVPTPGQTPVPPDGIQRLPWSCDFETNECGMVQPTDDRFDWLRQSVSTPTVATGPDQAQQGNYFIYAEASDPRVPGDTALLSTPMFNEQGDACVMFYYHLYGSGMGTLRVYVTRLGRSRTFFEKIGNQGNQWQYARVTASGLSFGDQITFEAIRGQSYTSDIALDDLRIDPGRCGATPPAPTPSPTIQPPGTGDGISCDVERIQVSDRNCILRQDRREDQIDWERGDGKTPSGALYSRRIRNSLYPVTGPMSAQQGRHYLYIEASGKPRDLVARLIIEGDDVRRGGGSCLRFAYSMNGFHIGELRVYTRVGRDARETRWSMSGDQGQGWQRAAVDVDMNGISEVGIEGTTRGEFSGDIAVDEFRLSPGACTTTPSQFIFVCNFETGDGSATLCSMVQDRNDRFDWTLWKGSTPSQVTGPGRAFSGSYYIYIEASRPRVTGDFAIITTQALNVDGDICVEFAYNMYGFHVGTLELFTRDAFNTDTVQWTQAKQQGNRWIQQRSTVSNFRPGSQVGFRGVRGQEYSGDIALDSIMIRRGRC